MSREICFDTSALAKSYLNEDRSEAVEAYLEEHGPVAISDLTVVEMRTLVARRRREKDIDALLETEVFVAFQEDISRRPSAGACGRHVLDRPVTSRHQPHQSPPTGTDPATWARTPPSASTSAEARPPPPSPARSDSLA